MTSLDTIAAVSPVFARAGSEWYFIEETTSVGKRLGLDGLRFYFLGRGGVLGDVEWPVVLSAFGYFEPGLVQKMWTTALERCDRAGAVSAHLEACEAWGRRRLSGLSDLGAFCSAAQATVEIAARDLGGLTLFAGYAAQSLPDDEPARAARLVAALRELRGSAHLAAVVAVGLPTPVAHRIRRPDFVELFGWTLDQIPEPTDTDRARLDEADRLTDRALARAYDRLEETQLAALRAGAAQMAAALGY
jgi:hypothetical protein